MKRVAIVQSNYVPWKGYFDLIAAVDEFIIYDDMQYTRRDWRNRNRIKTPQGLRWLTVPVHVKGKFYQKIRETEIDSTTWIENHWKNLCMNYRQAQHYEEISAEIEPYYREKKYKYLSDLNRNLIYAICGLLGIKTKFTNSWDYMHLEGKTERLVGLCKQAGADEYISGPTARGYLEEQKFIENGIKLTWFDYEGYPEYPQLWGGFVHGVTILDLLFNCGPEAPRYMKYVL